MKKLRTLLIFCCVLTLSFGLCLLSACGKDKATTTTYNDGDIIVTKHDIEHTQNSGSGSQTYSESIYQIEFLAGNRSVVRLAGNSPDQLTVVDHVGDVKKFKLADIEKKAVDGVNLSVVAINPYAFQNCTSLTEVDLTKKNASLDFTIGAHAFDGCSSLSTLTVLGTKPNVYTSGNTIGAYAFKGTAITEFKLSDNTFSSIGDYAFQDCFSLRTVTLPTDFTYISNGLFNNCTSLSELTIPETVTEIGSNVFENCYSLDVLDIPESVTKIGSYAFRNCYALSELTIPDNIERMSGGIIEGCDSISTLTIPYLGASQDEPRNIGYLYGTTNDSIPSTLSNVVITGADYYVTESYYWNGYEYVREYYGGIDISSSAFENCYHLKNVTLPEQTMSIGQSAFANCYSLESIVLPELILNVPSRAFSNCWNLASIEFTEWSDEYSHNYRLEEIQDRAFERCFALESLTIPSTVKEIGSAILYDCTSLAELDVPFIGPQQLYSGYSENFVLGYFFGVSASAHGGDYLPTQGNASYSYLDKRVYYPTYIGEDGYEHNDYENPYRFKNIPETLKSVNVSYASQIRYQAFMDCADIEEVSAVNVYQVSDYAFSGCTSLASVDIPNLHIIDSYAFEDCTSLTGLEMLVFDTSDYNTSTYSIGNYAFAGSGITSFVIPNYIYSLGQGTFANCASLASVTFDNTIYLEGLGSYTFENCIALESIEIPSNIRNLGSYTFSGCTALSSVNLPNVYNIGQGLFKGCTSLTSIDLPENITSILPYAFADSGIADIDLAGVLTINNQAFANCLGLVEVSISESTTVYYEAFKDCTNLVLVRAADVTYFGDRSFEGADGVVIYVENIGSYIETENPFGAKNGRVIAHYNPESLNEEVFEIVDGKVFLKDAIPAPLNNCGYDGINRKVCLDDVTFTEFIVTKATGKHIYNTSFDCTICELHGETPYVAGKLVDENGNDIVGATVKLISNVAESTTRELEVVTNVNGEYIFYKDDEADVEFNESENALLLGDYVLVFAINGYDPLEIQISITETNKSILVGEVELLTALDIGDGGTVPTYAISGKVYDSITNYGVAGVTVEAWAGFTLPTLTREVVMPVATAITESDGSYTFPQLPRGYYTFVYTSTVGEIINSTARVTASRSKSNLFTYTMDASTNQDKDLHAVLSWGNKPGDLDAHLAIFKNDGDDLADAHINFVTAALPGMQEYTNALYKANLDIDARNNGSYPSDYYLNYHGIYTYGSETISISEFLEGANYVYYVHNFSLEAYDRAGSNSDYLVPEKGAIPTSIANSGASVTVLYGGEIITINAPISNDNKLYWVPFVYEDGKLIIVNKYFDEVPVEYAIGDIEADPELGEEIDLNYFYNMYVDSLLGPRVEVDA